MKNDNSYPLGQSTVPLQPILEEGRPNPIQIKTNLIDLSELGYVLKSQGFNPTNQELIEMISDVDENEDDKISFEEFLILMHSRLKKSDIENELNEAFNAYDKSGKGVISVKEFNYKREKYKNTNLGYSWTRSISFYNKILL